MGLKFSVENLTDVLFPEIIFIYLFILLNFNYTDLNVQIVHKLTIKINEKLQKLQDLNN